MQCFVTQYVQSIHWCFFFKKIVLIFRTKEACAHLAKFIHQAEKRFHNRKSNHRSLHSILDTSLIASGSFGSSETYSSL